MAELGLLRQVEVLSTVSGGSILGALYYVHLKRLLEAKADADIEAADYVRLLERMESDFVTAVQQNIRMRTFLNPLKNLRMTRANYSRSDRIGELYDALLYRPGFDPGRQHMIEMRELKIQPPDAPAGFYPRTHNAQRRAKVPILLLNATTLNTGHNWRFEASTMGAPPRTRPPELEVDKNLRLLRPKAYSEIIRKQQNVELGLAVAASACVPGIFPPLALSDLYAGGIRVQLVDGGVHDNQGIQGLLDEGCTHLIVSDASGQMEDEPDPATRILAVLGRSNSIVMDRVREEELFGVLDDDHRAVALVHLRKGLPVESVPWIGVDGQPAPGGGELLPPMSRTFGVHLEVQRLLSRIRTDLDSFTEIEADSLMLDGYLMSGDTLRAAQGIADLIPANAPSVRGNWKFLAVRPWLERPNKEYLKHLRVGKEHAFKVFRLSPLVTIITVLVAGVIAWLLWWWQAPRIQAWWRTPVTIGQLVMGMVILALGFIPWASRYFKWLRFLRPTVEIITRFFIRGLVPALGAGLVWIHLRIFDRLFLFFGRVGRLRPRT
jgi:NTE family protein